MNISDPNPIGNFRRHCFWGTSPHAGLVSLLAICRSDVWRSVATTSSHTHTSSQEPIAQAVVRPDSLQHRGSTVADDRTFETHTPSILQTVFTRARRPRQVEPLRAQSTLVRTGTARRWVCRTSCSLQTLYIPRLQQAPTSAIRSRQLSRMVHSRRSTLVDTAARLTT